jgi:hypothetical protein
MEFALVYPPIIAAWGGLLVVALVASLVPLAQGRLPWILRVARFPLLNTRDPNAVVIAASVLTEQWIIRAYRIGLILLVCLSVATQVRSATSPELNAQLGVQPLVVCVVDLVALFLWSVYVVSTFRLASEADSSRTQMTPAAAASARRLSAQGDTGDLRSRRLISRGSTIIAGALLVPPLLGLVSVAVGPLFAVGAMASLVSGQVLQKGWTRATAVSVVVVAGLLIFAVAVLVGGK